MGNNFQRQSCDKCEFVAKINSHNAKIDFPVFLFDFYICYNELSFKRGQL